MQLTARVTASVLSVAEMRARQLPAADISTDITAANGTAEVKLDLKAQGGLALSLSGTVGYEANGKVALASRGTVPLSLANVLVADRAMRIAPLAGRVSIHAPRVGERLRRADGKCVVSVFQSTLPAWGSDPRA